MKKGDIKKVERLVDLISAVDDIPIDDPRRKEIYVRVKEIVDNEIKI